jgi:hypothetical protein
MSVRTTIRDRIVQEFAVMQQAESGRVPEFDISLRWLTVDEGKRAATYCVLVTDETRNAGTLQYDDYELVGAVVLYAHETRDPRGKLDLMIEDALEVLRRAFRGLEQAIERAMVEEIKTTESSTAEGEWPQAVIRWRALHRRAVMV